MTDNDLVSLLQRLDGKPYPAYKDLRGRYDFGPFMLSLDHIQGDPFAAPSRLSILIDHSASRIPEHLFSNRSRRIGAENALALEFSDACRKGASRSGSGKSGLVSIDTPGQEMLARTCVEIGESRTVVRFVAGLPANGRRITGRAAKSLLVDRIKEIVENALVRTDRGLQRLEAFADANEDADRLRALLPERGLIAFIADGAILPRASGINQAPMPNAIPSKAPDSLSVTLDLPHAGPVTGMGIPEGVTLIVGGGYHGKSTLLQALERGVYNHRPGDGRELVVARRDATKVRAEDGRSIANVDLSPFINNLPGGKDTQHFTTEDASGSTSQAANIIEALEAGSRVLLLDEDISATNFLIRDARMQRLIAPEKEPITPFVQRVGALHEQHGVSTVLVLGGSSDYFEPAHQVIAMENYLPRDLTAEAKALCDERHDTTVATAPFALNQSLRYPLPSSVSPYKAAKPYRGGRRDSERPQNRPPRKNIKAFDTRAIVFGVDEIDLSLLPQLVDPSQVRAIGAALLHTIDQKDFGKLPLIESLQRTVDFIQDGSLSLLGGHDLAEIRLQELAAALNRLRSLHIQNQPS